MVPPYVSPLAPDEIRDSLVTHAFQHHADEGPIKCRRDAVS